MVELNDDTKLTFRKIDDPNDTYLERILKYNFRYSSPNLFIWGLLAPAHDALLPRTIMARLQVSLGIILIGATFRRFPSTTGKLNRIFSRGTSFLAGNALLITGIREISFYNDPLSNPLYIEIQLARELSALNPDNNGKPNKGNYWFGPKNFMPMTNKQYWQMVYSLEVNEILADQYLNCDLINQYNKLIENKFSGELINSKNDELTNRISDIINSKSDLKTETKVHPNTLINSNVKLFNEKLSKIWIKDGVNSKTLLFWSQNNPFDTLQLMEYKDYYSYIFPRLKFQKKNSKK